MVPWRQGKGIRKGFGKELLVAGIGLLMCTAQAGAQIRIDAGYPGGNIVLQRIEGNNVYLHQDLRDTPQWWFYWNFRVRGAAGRTLTFHFTNRNVIDRQGPAISLDDGSAWSWLGTKTVSGASFSYTFGPDADNVRFCYAMPYTEANLNRFLANYENNPHLKLETLCQTRKGRKVERLRLGKLDGEPRYRVALTCRHHACEMMASYTLEGLMEALLMDSEAGRWLSRNVEFLVIPFMDKDGVEDGDQGKNRRPHDHGRDYGHYIYPAVKALCEFLPPWSAGRLRVALDLHCPWMYGDQSEVIYLVGSQAEAIWQQQCKFSTILEAIQSDPLPFQSKDNLPFGRSWNTARNYAGGKGCSEWVRELPGVRLTSAIEIPYANAGGKEVNQESAKAFGYDLARALYLYLQEIQSSS